MARMRAPWVGRCLGPIWRGLVAYGMLYLPEASVLPVIGCVPPPGPPAGHPEALCSEVPPSPEESVLWAQLPSARPPRSWS